MYTTAASASGMLLSDVIGGKRKEREHPAEKHQPRPPRAQNPRALRGERHHEQQREHDREPNHQNLDHRIPLGQQLDDRILRRKRKQREHAVKDAGYGAMGGVDREVRQGLKQGSLRAAGEFTIAVPGRWERVSGDAQTLQHKRRQYLVSPVTVC
jgi:hypothetical protein